MINGKQTEVRKEMYQKYKKSSIFNSDNANGNANADVKHSAITNKVNEKKYKAKFEPKYNEKNAREQYIKQFWQKDPQCVPKKSSNANNKLLKKSLGNNKMYLNANDIMCRDMYSNCNVKEYQMRRSKSTYLKRSCNYLNQTTVNNTIRNSNANGNTNGINMNSKERFVDSLQSNIFFSSECNATASNGNGMITERKEICNRISIYPQDNDRLTSQSKIPNNRITHSKLTTNCDWKYVNTEIASERLSLNQNKLNGTYNHFKKSQSIKAFNNSDYGRHSLLDPNQKENYSNMNSVQYDIISLKEGVASKNGIAKPNKAKANGINGISSLKHQAKAKGTSANSRVDNSQIEEYQIDVPKEFDTLNIKEIKNMFYTEGIHLYKCETKANTLSNNSGKIIFKVRKDKNGNDKEYSAKIETIQSKIANNQMALNKTARNTLRPITELVSVKEKILYGFKDKTIEKRLKRCQTPGSELKTLNLTNSNSNGHSNEVITNTTKNSRNSNIQFDKKFKNQCIYTKLQEKAAIAKT